MSFSYWHSVYSCKIFWLEVLFTNFPQFRNPQTIPDMELNCLYSAVVYLCKNGAQYHRLEDLYRCRSLWSDRLYTGLGVHSMEHSHPCLHSSPQYSPLETPGYYPSQTAHPSDNHRMLKFRAVIFCVYYSNATLFKWYF